MKKTQDILIILSATLLFASLIVDGWAAIATAGVAAVIALAALTMKK